MSAATLRLDKWLWYARFFKSRTLAAAACRGGGIRINRSVVAKSNASVRAGDVVTFAHVPYVRVVRIMALGTRRGPAPEARTLYEDLAPPEAQPPVRRAGTRAPGAGRPTKRDRRRIGILTGDD